MYRNQDSPSEEVETAEIEVAHGSECGAVTLTAAIGREGGREGGRWRRGGGGREGDGYYICPMHTGNRKTHYSN